MSAFHLLIRELVRRGGSVTYDQLEQDYGHRYEFKAFAAAVYSARRRGLITRGRKRGVPIMLADGAECPCCGRRIVDGR